MDELVGMGFQLLISLIFQPAGSAVDTAVVVPGMLNIFIQNVACRIFKYFSDGVFTIRRLGAIERPSGKQSGQFGNCDTKNLVTEDVVDSLLLVGYLFFEPLHEALGNLPKEDA